MTQDNAPIDSPIDFPIRVAAVQMISTPHPAENIAVARRLVAQAAQQGAQLVLLP
ncbi:MAG: carbon-nitrogen hydrolase family protein, partial [Oxalobacteraceae bacterium]